FHAFGWHWPTFNLADVAITCGVVMLVFANFLISRSENSLQDQKP
ncbi:MAG: signal peptidase II, partial [Hyphomicrobium sp.]